MPPTRFRLDLDPLGPAAIQLDGIGDVTDQVAGIELHASPHQPTVLTLHLTDGGSIEGAGIVQAVAPSDDRPEGQLIAEWLQGIDPQQLEQAALMHATVGRSLTAAMLAILTDWSTGGTPP